MAWHDDFADILETDRPLAPLTTYGVGGTARWFFTPGDAETTARLLGRLCQEGMEFRVLGGGANVLIEDGVHETPVVSTVGMNKFVVDGNRVVAGAGFSFPKLVQETVAQGLEGMDGLCGIPGQVGGACAMNAGGRHGEFGDHIVEIECATVEGSLQRLSKDEVSFSYRRTVLPVGIVTEVTVDLRPTDDPASLRRGMGAILRSKGAAQPLKQKSGGCIFVNPDGENAGRLIESLGLKGERRGEACISEKHGNFIVNEGEARFGDVMELVRLAEERSRHDAGVSLRREIKIWRRQPGDLSAGQTEGRNNHCA